MPHLLDPNRRRRGGAPGDATRNLDDLLNARHSFVGLAGVGRRVRYGSRGRPDDGRRHLPWWFGGVAALSAVFVIVLVLALAFGVAQGGALGGLEVILRVLLFALAGVVLVALLLVVLTTMMFVVLAPGRAAAWLWRLGRGNRNAD